MHKLGVLKRAKQLAHGLPEQQIRGGAWNTRRMGSVKGTIDPAMKITCFLDLAHARSWNFILLSDLNFGANGVREYRHHGTTWVLLIRGKVGIMMTHRLHAVWKKGGETSLSRGSRIPAPPGSWLSTFNGKGGDGACFSSLYTLPYHPPRAG
jgi:hypothetical protein